MSSKDKDKSSKDKDKDDWVQNSDGTWTQQSTGEIYSTDSKEGAGKDSTSSKESSSAKDAKDTSNGASNGALSCGANALSAYPAPQRCITHAGSQRCWYEYVSSPAPAKPSPVFLDLHGYGSCGASQAALSG